MRLHPWLLAARPKTLSAAAVPVVMAAGLAYRQERNLPWIYALCALAAALLIQIATNYINDALDFQRGADSSARLGPLRVTQAGLLPAASVLRGALLVLFVAALLGIPLILRGGWPILLIGLCSMLLAYAYTGGPYPLAYHGLGELFVLSFFGVIAVGGTYYVLTLQYRAAVFLAGLVAGSLAVVILAINNLRDIDGDRASQKRTLAVRLGAAGARTEIALFLIGTYVLQALVAFALAAPSLLLPLLTAPLAVYLMRRVLMSSGAALNHCLGLAAGLQALFGILFLIGTLVR